MKGSKRSGELLWGDSSVGGSCGEKGSTLKSWGGRRRLMDVIDGGDWKDDWGLTVTKDRRYLKILGRRLGDWRYRLEVWRYEAKIGCCGGNYWLETSRTRNSGLEKCLRLRLVASAPPPVLNPMERIWSYDIFAMKIVTLTQGVTSWIVTSMDVNYVSPLRSGLAKSGVNVKVISRSFTCAGNSFP